MEIHEGHQETLQRLARDMAKIIHHQSGHREPFYRCPEQDCQLRRATIERGQNYAPLRSDLLAMGEISEGEGPTA